MKISNLILLSLSLAFLSSCGDSSNKSSSKKDDPFSGFALPEFDSGISPLTAVYPPGLNGAGACKQLHLGSEKTHMGDFIVQGFTPDEKKYIISGASSLRVLDLKSLKIKTFKGMSALRFMNIAFDQNHSFLAMDAADSQYSIEYVSFDIETGSITKLPKDSDRKKISLAQTANDGSHLVSYPLVYNAQNFERIDLLESFTTQYQSHEWAFSLDKKVIYFVSDNMGDVNSDDYESYFHKYTFATGELSDVVTLKGRLTIAQLTHLQDGSHELLSVLKGGVLRVYDIHDKTWLPDPEPRRSFEILERMSDGKRILAYDEESDGEVRLAMIYDLFTGEKKSLPETTKIEFISATGGVYLTKDRGGYTVKTLEGAEEVCHFTANFSDYVGRDKFREIVSLNSTHKSFGFFDADGNYRFIKFEKN